jgi:DNA-binding CsgD family transcriptional regulator
MSGDLVGLLESAYTLEGDDRAWLTGLAAEFSAHCAAAGRAVAFFHDRRTERYVANGPPVVLGMGAPMGLLLGSGLKASGRYMGKLARSMPDVTTASRALGRNSWLGRFPAMSPVLRAVGVRDVLTLRAEDPEGPGCSLSAALERPRQLSSREQGTWRRVAAHIAAGLRLRRRLGGSNPTREAVLTPAGQVVHAEPSAVASRAEISGAALQRERARGRLRKTHPSAAVEVWEALVDGQWSLIDEFESDGRRYVIACRNAPSCPILGNRQLTPRETEVLSYVALGHANKLIAYELGLQTATVAKYISSAMLKLSVTSRAALIASVTQCLRPSA